MLQWVEPNSVKGGALCGEEAGHLAVLALLGAQIPASLNEGGKWARKLEQKFELTKYSRMEYIVWLN